MEALVNNLRLLFANGFDAEVTKVNVSMSNHADPIYSMNGSFGGYQQGHQYYTIEITVMESQSKYLKHDSPAHTLMYAIKHGLLNDLLKGPARIQKLHVNCDAETTNFKTTIDIVVIDINEFNKSLEEANYKAYNEKFLRLLENKLSED